MRKPKVEVDRWAKPYKGFTLAQAATRVGSLDILKNPSRYHKTLYYPDGRIKHD